MNDLRYPVGKPEGGQQFTPEERRSLFDEIAAAPERLRKAVAGLNDQQLDTPYRDGGWSVRQVVHHAADSHLNAYIRTKLALTENEPTIKPYDEAAWAKLADSRDTHTPVEVSVSIIDNVHQRWLTLLRSLSEEDFARTFRHPEHGVRTLDWLVGLYAWHGRHHTAHITSLRERNGW
jgi:uncharacterized damage-inducible protein DinB